MADESGAFRDVLDNLYDGVYFVDTDRRITYWNRGAERITGFAASEVMSKHCSDYILIHVDDKGNHLCKTGCPLLATIRDDTTGEAEVYLHHRDGHRLPIVVRAVPMHDEKGEVVGAAEVFYDNSEAAGAAKRIQQLEHEVLLDSLTSVANRRHAQAHLRTHIDGLHRYGWSLGLLFIDIDRFKQINDAFGHETGDHVLSMVAKTLSNCSRSVDMVARWGREEFVVSLPAIDEDGMARVAERARVLVAESGFRTPQGPVRVTISVGATLARSDDDVASLAKRADELMYQSKAAGRNRVSLAA